MLEALMPSGNLMTSQSLILRQLQQWAVQSATPITLFFATAILGSALKIWTSRHTKTDGRPLPPSPGIALPVVGHLHTMKMGGDPRVTFSDMREKLGDIFSFYAGNRLVVVLNGYHVIHEALVKKAAIFSHRASTFMSEQMGQGRGIVNTSGAHWREHRRFAERTLRELAAGKASTMGHKIQNEVDCLVECLDRFCDEGQPVDPRKLLSASCCNVVISLVYGHRFDLNDPKFEKIMTALTNCFDNFGNTQALNFFPLVRFLPGDPCSYWYCIKNMNVLEDTLVHPELAEHEQKLNEESAESNDVVSVYLNEMTQKREKGISTYMDKNNLVKVAGDMVGGGSQMTSTTALWALLYMVRFPQVQDRCYEELLSHVGKDRAPTLDDQAHLPFLEATIREVQRHADIGPLGMTHAPSRDAELLGFHVPKEAIVITNLHSVHRDPRVWGDPEAFRPERFLGEDGRTVKRHDHFVPFSIGPRTCPGENFARLELFLYIATILHRYRLSHHGPTPPSLEGHLALLNYPAPFSLVLERRQ